MAQIAGAGFRVNGLCAATFTPLTKDGKINLTVIERYVDSLMKNGIRNVFVNGTTGEGASLTVEERKELAGAWVEAGRGKLDCVIIHVGASNLPDSMELSRHAQSIGAHAIGALPTVFFKPANLTALIAYLRELTAAAPKLPFYYYHIPALSGVDFNMEDFLEAAKNEIPTLAGIKFSSNDLTDAGRCLQVANGRYQVMYGRDEQLLSARALGITAAVGSTYNFMAPIYHRMLAAYERGDMETAQREQARSQAVVRTLMRHIGRSASVGLLKVIGTIVLGFDLGPTRLPNLFPESNEQERIREEMENLGLFKWIK